jgi:hypothetical protein
MLATMQRMTTTGPRSGGSRFFASPPCVWPRAPRSHDTRPAHRHVSRKLASGFFRSSPAPHARRVAAQAADERPACTIFSYQTASGYTVAPNNAATNTQLYGLVVTTSDGHQYMPITRVKNEAQAKVLGLKVGDIIPVMAPQNGADIMSNLVAQAGKLNVFEPIAFKNMWRNTSDNPNNFKISLQPTSLYDQFGNFAYGATAEVVGYPLWFTQRAGAYGRNGSLTNDNLPINQRDIASGYNAARAGGTYSVAPVDFGGPGP